MAIIHSRSLSPPPSTLFRETRFTAFMQIIYGTQAFFYYCFISLGSSHFCFPFAKDYVGIFKKAEVGIFGIIFCFLKDSRLIYLKD